MCFPECSIEKDITYLVQHSHTNAQLDSSYEEVLDIQKWREILQNYCSVYFRKYQQHERQIKAEELFQIKGN